MRTTQPLKLTPEEQRQHDHVSIPLGSEDEIIEAYHRLVYDVGWRTHRLAWHSVFYKGYKILKLPQDLWLYREIIEEVKPHTVLETGTFVGGSALYFADLLEQYNGRGKGTVITIDSAPLNARWPAHPRIFYVPSFDSSTWPPKQGIYAGGLKISVPPYLEPPVLVVLDSDHSKDHVLKELGIFAPLVSDGSYLIVEDSNVNGHPTYREHGPGPFEALEEWLPQHPEFKPDLARAGKHLFSFHTWLRKVTV